MGSWINSLHGEQPLGSKRRRLQWSFAGDPAGAADISQRLGISSHSDWRLHLGPALSPHSRWLSNREGRESSRQHRSESGTGASIDSGVARSWERGSLWLVGPLAPRKVMSLLIL